MLERLDPIAWHALAHAYGPADDVPGLLRALAAEQRRVLHAVIGSPQVGRIEANVLAGFGLPFSRDELHSLLDRTAAP